MTIYEAIKRECNDDFFVEKTEYVKTYRDAIEHFVYSTVDRALKKCSEGGVVVYNKGPALTKLGLEEDYNIAIINGEICKTFPITFTVKKCKDRNGWGIKVTSTSKLLNAEDLKKFVMYNMKYIWRGNRYEAEDRDREECFGEIRALTENLWGAEVTTKYSFGGTQLDSKKEATEWVEENLPKYVLGDYNFLLQEAEQFKKDYYPY